MGRPRTLVSDSGGAYTSDDFEAVCTRLQIQHETIVSTQGESYLNWMETHFNIQRRLVRLSVLPGPHPGGVGAAPSGLHPDLQHHRPSGAPEGSAAPADPGRGLGRGARAASIPRRSSPATSPRPCSRGPPTGMAVSPCTATTSMSRRAYPRRRCCCGWLASSCGRRLRT